MNHLLIRDLFVSDVTRDIPPVVYFHEQSPAKLEDEVSEYIVTGGWPDDHPNHRRVPNGIHEQYVRLLTNIADELDKKGGPELPNAWVSGFYGSGKSSFAKLLGLALDGVALPDGRSLVEALLARDTSPRSAELRQAWARLRQKIDPIAAVFDVGGSARDDEHIHSVAVRQVQVRLGYSAKNAHVAYGELEIERAGRWPEFTRLATDAFGGTWSSLKDEPQAQARFSNLMARLYPDVYRNERDWHMRHGGTAVNALSPEEAIVALRDMLRFRQPGATLFLVVDEVSQYVLANTDRVERLRAFASALGSGLKGKAWLVALGQQKLEEDADASFLVKTKDRFPPKLRVHLAATNIRDVVHKRLLQKKPEVEPGLRALFERHRADLKLYAYGCEAVTPEEFVEVYPMLPGHIDLLLQITSALRTRSTRAQGDDQAIRGLLQLLGELFRDQKLADVPTGALVTLDQIYEVQNTALDSDVQASMARILNQCADDASGLLTRVAKAVSLLELVQETLPTDAKLVSQCLYDRIDRGNQVNAVTAALEDLRLRNLLGYSEKLGYKIQSSAAEEWERDRRDVGVPRESISDLVKEALKYLLATPERPRLSGRPFPWAGVFSDGRQADNVVLVEQREDAVIRVDFRFVAKEERTDSAWVKRSDESALRDRLVWVCGESDPVDHFSRELFRSRQMVKKYEPRRESLNPARKLLVQQEKNRVEELEPKVRDAVAASFLAGRLYFQARPLTPADQGTSFATALSETASRILPSLFPHFVATTVAPSELLQLVEGELSGPSPKFLTGDLGILELDGGKYVPRCSGVVPTRVREHVESEGGLGGTTLLAHFGGPPYGYTANVVKACVAGLLRAGSLRIQPDGGPEITAVRDAGVKDLFDKDRSFRRASYFPAGDDDIGFQARARICTFFETHLQHHMDREDDLIANAVSQLFPTQARRLRDLLTRLTHLPGGATPPEALTRLQEVLEQCIATSRQTKPTVQLVKKRLDALRDGIQLLNVYDAELTADAIQAVRRAATVRDQHVAQLEAVKMAGPIEPEAGRIRAQLASERPWREIGSLEADLGSVIETYTTERRARMLWQEHQAEAARARLKSRQGFSTLTAEQSHQVLRPIALALTDTSAEAIAPALSALRDPFTLALQRAEEEANELLDELLSGKKLITKCYLNLHNRELATVEDVDALLVEIRERLLAQIATGARVRLV